jgi:hypothetical protein
MQAPQIQQTIGVAAALIDQYRQLVESLAAAAARGDGDEHAVNRAHIERVYSSIWEQLDSAAQLTREAGRPVIDYDNLRAQRETGEAAVSGTSQELVDVEHKRTETILTIEHTVHYNRLGLALATEATSSLQKAWPDVDWTDQTAAPDADLRPGGLHRVVRGIARLFGKR